MHGWTDGFLWFYNNFYQRARFFFFLCPSTLHLMVSYSTSWHCFTDSTSKLLNNPTTINFSGCNNTIGLSPCPLSLRPLCCVVQVFCCRFSFSVQLIVFTLITALCFHLHTLRSLRRIFLCLSESLANKAFHKLYIRHFVSKWLLQDIRRQITIKCLFSYCQLLCPAWIKYRVVSGASSVKLSAKPPVRTSES